MIFGKLLYLLGWNESLTELTSAPDCGRYWFAQHVFQFLFIMSSYNVEPGKLQMTSQTAL